MVFHYRKRLILGFVFPPLLIALISMTVLDLAQGTVVHADTSDIIISEVFEGSAAAQQYIELYNGTGATVDFDTTTYILALYDPSGNDTADHTLTLTGQMATGTARVYGRNTSTIYAGPPTPILSNQIDHSGNDFAYVLWKGSVGGTVVDSFGRTPNTAAYTGNVATSNITLRRQSFICTGDTVTNDTFLPASEWLDVATTGAGLGAHTMSCPGGNAPTNLIISEYIEGATAAQSYIEIYNGTGATINLTGYSLERHDAAAAAVAATISLGTSDLANGATLVMANTGHLVGFYAGGVTTSASIVHDGDDAYVLLSGATVIDSIGSTNGADPGTQWINTVAAGNTTLRRKAGVCSGDLNYADAFDPSIEWFSTGTGTTVSGLGAHVNNCDSAPALSSSSPSNGAVGVANTANIVLTFSEAVTLTGNVMSLSCPSYGVADTVTAAEFTTSDNLTFTYNPSANFALAELCSVTVFAATVTDNDTVDAPNTMASNASFSFTTATTATITGTITDDAGQPLNDVLVTYDTGGPILGSDCSDEDGNYSLSPTQLINTNVTAGGAGSSATCLDAKADGYTVTASAVASLGSSSSQIVNLSLDPQDAPLAPVINNATVNGSNQAVIEWNHVSQASSYRVYLRSETTLLAVADVTPNQGPSCLNDVCSFTSGTLPVSPYSVWVRASNSVGTSAWSAYVVFAVGTPITVPVKPVISAPSGSTSGDTSPDVVWAHLSNATNYEVVIYKYGPVQVIFNDLNVTVAEGNCVVGGNCTYTGLPSLNDGVYRTFVRAYNAGGYGPWSAGVNFNVSLSLMAPMQSRVFGPEGTVNQLFAGTGLNAVVIRTNNPVIEWLAVEGSTNYRVYVRQLATSNVVYDATVLADASLCVNGTCSLAIGTLANGDYEVYVYGINLIGEAPWSSAYVFTIASSGGGTVDVPTQEPVIVPTLPPFVDSDGDMVEDSVDNCLALINPTQVDSDGDGLGDECDVEAAPVIEASTDVPPAIEAAPVVEEAALVVEATEASAP